MCIIKKCFTYKTQKFREDQLEWENNLYFSETLTNFCWVLGYMPHFYLKLSSFLEKRKMEEIKQNSQKAKKKKMKREKERKEKSTSVRIFSLFLETLSSSGPSYPSNNIDHFSM